MVNSQASEWGVPNWRDESDYPSEKTSLNTWRWEFTRRRPDYRDEWHKYKWETYELWKQVHGEDRTLHPDGCGFRVNIPGSLRKYGLISCPNPAEATPKLGGGGPVIHLFENNGGSFVSGISDEPRSTTIFLDAMCVAVTFDLSKPLGKQIERARKNLEMNQKFKTGENPSFRRHTSKWSTYLRVIDARDDEQTYGTIAREILRYTRDEDQAGYQEWKLARNLMFNFPS